MRKHATFGLIAGLLSASVASAASTDIVVDPTNTIPGTVANLLQADGDGVDWTGEALVVELTAGSVYNAPAFDDEFVQQAFWGLVPELQWDTAIGIPGDATMGVGGGLACPLIGPCSNVGLVGLDNSPQFISASWFNTNVTDTSLVQTGTITLSDDGAGTWQRITSFGDGTLIRTGGPVIDGALVPEPSALAVLGTVCILGGAPQAPFVLVRITTLTGGWKHEVHA